MNREEFKDDYVTYKAHQREEFNANAYYFIIAIISVLMLVFLPMLGTQVGLEFDVPNTTIGWIVYCTTKIIVCVGNMLIFHSFVQQGHINIKNDVNYRKARDLLEKDRIRKIIPRGPKAFFRKLYLTKGTSVFLSTLVSVVALTQALMSFDILSFLTYLFTIIMGIVFGVMTMFDVENYYTTEYVEYANYITKEAETNGNN